MFTVFLAYVTDNLYSECGKLVRFLQASGVRVAPTIGFSLSNRDAYIELACEYR